MTEAIIISKCTSAVLFSFLSKLSSFLSTNLTSTYSLPDASRFECLRDWARELRVLIDGGQPEAELVDKIMTGSPGSVALNERSGPEITQAGTWA